MASLFISYSRKDIEVARKFTGRFNGQGLDFWIDWEDIPPTVDWWKEIQKGIEEADIFLFLISPDSAGSKVCRQEIEHAVKNGKRLIPVVVRDIKAEESPTELRPLNWIFVRENDDFNLGFGKLIDAIKTDYEWVQMHRQMQVKALEWARSNKENSFLLRGKELKDAEYQLATNFSKEPLPTDLQRDYVRRSRQASDRQRRTIISISIMGIGALAALAVFGSVQTGLKRSEANRRATAQAEAEARAKIVRAGELAAQSASLRDTNFPISLLLGIEAYQSSDTVESYSSLLNNTQANPQLHGYLQGHTTWVNSVAFSPDGKLLASGSGDGIVILWNVASQQRIGDPLTGHTNSVSSVSFSPDGKTLASSSDDKTVILWDVTSQQPIGDPLTNPDSVNSVAFSPDGKMLASASCGEEIQNSELNSNECIQGRVILWDVASHQPVGQPLNGHTFSISTVAFSPDGKMLASGSGDGIILWDVASHQPIGESLAGPDYVFTMAFSPDGKILASGSNDGAIILWDVVSHQAIGKSPAKHTDEVDSIVFSPDGKLLASGGLNPTIVLWDVASLEPIGQLLTKPNDYAASVAFSPDGKLLASGNGDSTVILWDVASQQPIGESLNEHTSSVSSVVFSPDGKILASASCGKQIQNVDLSIDECVQGQIVLWDVTSHQTLGQPLIGHTNVVQSVAFSPDGKTLASGGRDGIIILWDASSQQPIGKPLTGHTGSVFSVAFSPDGKILASASSDTRELGSSNGIMLWDVASQQPVGKPLTGPTNSVYSVAFSPNGKALASGNGDGTISFWDVASQQPISTPSFVQTFSVFSIAFNPSGKMLALGGNEGTVILWDVISQQSIGEPLTGHKYSVTSVAFSSDGMMLASGSDDKTVILWDTVSRRPLGEPLASPDSVNTVAFSADGKTLASGSADGTIILWELDPQSWVRKACQRVGRNFTRAEWVQYFPNEEYRKTCEQWPLES